MRDDRHWEQRHILKNERDSDEEQRLKEMNELVRQFPLDRIDEAFRDSIEGSRVQRR